MNAIRPDNPYALVASAALVMANALDDETQYAAAVTRIVHELWPQLRPDPLPDPIAFAHHVVGLGMHCEDGAKLIEAILTYGEREVN